MYKRRPVKKSLSTVDSILPGNSQNNASTSVTSKPNVINRKRKLSSTEINKPSDTTEVPSNNKSGQNDDNVDYYEKILIQSGLITRNNPRPLLTKDQSLVMKEIQKNLENEKNYPNNIKTFVNSFEKVCEDAVFFKKMLIQTELEKESDAEVVSGIQQESVIRILLTIDSLQSDLIQRLLDKILEIVIEEDENNNLLSMILKPLRFLPSVQASSVLAERLLDIILSANKFSQPQLICCLPDILFDVEHDKAATELSKLIKEDVNIVSAVVECLNHLSLSPIVLSEVKDNFLQILKTVNVPFMHIPKIIEFLLNSYQPEEIGEIVKGIRTTLDFTISEDKSKSEYSTYQKLTCDCLQMTVMKSSVLATAWLKLILSIKNSNNHKPFDIIMLLILRSSTTNRKKVIDGIFKKRILSGHFKVSLLETTINKCMTVEVFKEYLTHILEIASSLIKTRGSLLTVDFATSMFTLSFSHTDAKPFQKHCVISELILLTGTADYGTIISALNVLSILTEKYSDDLQPFSSVLLGLLDKIEDLKINEVRKVMDILCNLAFSSSNGNILQDNIHIMVRKQLSSLKRDIKLKGIVGAVMAVKYIASDSNTNDNCSVRTDQSFNSVSELPCESAKQAALLIELISVSTKSYTEANGLMYDQVAAMLYNTENLNKYFMSWLMDATVNDFTTFFITEEIPPENDGIKFTMQYGINDPAEEEATIAINIGGLCGTKTDGNGTNLAILAPYFHLMRQIHHKQHGDLTAINALLGCAVIMPQIAPEEYKSLDLDQAKWVLDCYFHCDNWFREIISGFIDQDDQSIHKKVSARLYDLIHLEEDIAKLVQYAPNDYRAPPAHFPVSESDNLPIVIKTTTKITAGAKKKRKVDLSTSTNTTKSNVTDVQEKSITETVTTRDSLRRSCFREVDNWLLFLREPLKIEDSEDTEEVRKESFNLPKLRFVLEDLVEKLNSISNEKKQDLDKISIFQIIKPIYLIMDCAKLLPSIYTLTKNINKYLQNLLDSSDGIRDSPVIFLGEKSSDAKVCFAFLLEIQALLFSYPQFQSNYKLVRDTLRSLVDKQHSTVRSVKSLIEEITEELVVYANTCLHLPSAISLVKLHQTLAQLSSDANLIKRNARLCETLLSMSWYDLKGKEERGLKYNIQIDTLIKGYLIDADLDMIQNIVIWMQEEITLLKTKADCLQTFPSIQKANFPLLYRAICAALSASVRGTLDAGMSTERHLTVWKTAATILHGLMGIVKEQDAKPNLAAFFKRALEILKIFLSKGMPILEITLSTKSETVIEILRTMQHSTRFLHNVCCHSKMTKDRSLIGLVPSMRLTLETLVFRVKAALVANNCSTAFWMGNLRNKNLMGEEILSQASTVSTDSNAANDEELLPSDVDDDDNEEDEESLTI